MTPAEEAAAAAVTILRARGRRLTKTVHHNGEITPYDSAKLFDIIDRPVGDIEQLAQLLRKLERRPDCCVVRGKPADPSHTTGVRRLLYPDRETGEGPTLAEAPRRWVALDIDGLPRPDWIEAGDLLGCGVVAIRELPVEFREALFLAQATASCGLRPGVRIRLWAWLSRPVCGAELKYWLRHAPADPAIFGAAQPIYTARPIFLPGAIDPLPTRLGRIPGRVDVSVPPREHLTPPSPIHRPAPTGYTADPIAGLVRAVESARAGNRNAALYWSARRVSENPAIDRDLAEQLLLAAAQTTGLGAAEATATIRSGFRG